jgi:hypothetical protein
VEGSASLAGWAPVADSPAGFSNGIELRKAAVPIDGGQYFLRLQVAPK